jgi:ABC-type sugar transport system permease subunit
MGYAAALAFSLFILVLSFTLVQLRLRPASDTTTAGRRA